MLGMTDNFSWIYQWESSYNDERKSTLLRGQKTDSYEKRQKTMRIFWIVLDSVGIGDAPDAAQFGDEGSNTLKRCYDSGKLHVTNMQKLGLFNIDGIAYGERVQTPTGGYARLIEQSMGKDTTTGHWEMAGMISKQPFPTYPEGFPKDVMDAFEEKTGRKVLCNLPYSGTEVLKVYGKEHVETGNLIVYTSADSVFQIAAHEEVIPVEKLYEYCKIARQILQGRHAVARVIARPFSGTYPDYVRTERRHDFSLEPKDETILDALKRAGKDVIGVGKISDIFAGKGITRSTPNHGNRKNMETVFEIARENFDGICYCNLVDFDMLYGHRRDIEGYTNALNEFDEQLGILLWIMKADDSLFMTADHGCDPGYKGTDHTRECVPLLYQGPEKSLQKNLGVRNSYADIAATIAEMLQVNYQGCGTSMCCSG